MPGEVIDRPNPQPLASHIDDTVLSLAVSLEKAKLDASTASGLQEFRRAANYIAAGTAAPEAASDLSQWLTWTFASHDLLARQCPPRA